MEATDLEAIERQIDRLYAELAALKRQVITQVTARADDEDTWNDLWSAAREISALWTGPDAVDEIRAQRDK